MTPDNWGTGWLDPAVEAELAKPRRRGRPPKCTDSERFKISLRLNGSSARARRPDNINRDVLDSRAANIAQQRRAELKLHRADRRNEGQNERRAALAGLVAMRPEKSGVWLASWLQKWIKNNRPSLNASLRTLRADVSALRISGSTTHAKKSQR